MASRWPDDIVLGVKCTLEASEKSVVSVLIFYFLYVHVTPGNIRTVLVNLSCFHPDAIVF